MQTLFGTDGIRGIANSYPITPEVSLRVGRAVASVLKNRKNHARIIIGKDPRLSSDMIVHALAAGVCSAGTDAELVGILPTPGIAYAVRATGANAGIVVSASHNPYLDNGIKIFGADGYKLSDILEAKIEEQVVAGTIPENGKEIGRVRLNCNADRLYIDFLKGCLSLHPSKLGGFRIILDCANGATYQVAPILFAELGASVEALFIDPDGMNINHNCGSQHPEILARKVVSNKADLGLAFDGDGDRLIAVDETGEVVSGDRLLAVCAQHLKHQSRLKNNIVVSTVMSNVGLGRTLRGMGVDHRTSQVGDRYVMEEMRVAGAVLGGEDSGHMIFAEHHTTGDGILTALMVLETMRVQSKPLSELKAIMTVFPQAQVNVPVKSKPSIRDVSEIQAAIREVEAELGQNGRVLVRYSGTEPLCRVMVEGPTKEKTYHLCRKIADAVLSAIG